MCEDSALCCCGTFHVWFLSLLLCVLLVTSFCLLLWRVILTTVTAMRTAAVVVCDMPDKDLHSFEATVWIGKEASSATISNLVLRVKTDSAIGIDPGTCLLSESIYAQACGVCVCVCVCLCCSYGPPAGVYFAQHGLDSGCSHLHRPPDKDFFAKPGVCCSVLCAGLEPSIEMHLCVQLRGVLFRLFETMSCPFFFTLCPSLTEPREPTAWAVLRDA